MRIVAMAAALWIGAQAAAQEAEPAAAETPVEALDPAALDDLVAPVALFPDSLLTQVLVASTYPLEIVKAERWVEDNAALEGDGRVAAVEAEGWDPSVGVLAAGFPDVVGRMADDLDATEALGEALLVDSDAVLDAVQRQRAAAAEIGNLESNDAQTVTVEGDDISIAPADPEVVYVPAYDPNVIYTQPAPSPPVVVEDDGYDSGDLLATGVLSFGAGMLVNEIFDDDDDWDDYWRGPPRVDWRGGGIYARPDRDIDIDVGGDVNIGGQRGRPRPSRRLASRP